MKILVLGDIHGRPFWKEIIDKESPDLTIFLGDYVTTHESYTPKMQLEELEKILSLKEQNPSKVILLRGNHDLDGLGYYWARCYPSAQDVQNVMAAPDFKARFLNATQWIYLQNINDKPTIFAHAGISECWLHEILKLDKFDVDMINDLEPNENFGFVGDRNDNYGTSRTQSCTWIRPGTLCQYGIKGYDQVVGHTGTGAGCIITETDNHDTIWLCDALQQKSYLIIEDDKYTAKEL